jgi:hypothetical protein
MSLKPLIVLAAVSFCCQIGFSVFYSIKIVDQSLLINTLETNLNQITIANQQLEIKLAKLGSLSSVVDQIKDKNYVPISSSVNLN